MKTIWKYDIKDGYAEMPTGSEILKVNYQHGILRLWAMVDPEEQDTTVRDFVVVGTGQELDDTFIEHTTYVDTVLQADGAFVWHIFETTGL